MSPGFAVFILMNNYFHDVATAMLLATGIAMLIILKRLENSGDKASVEYFFALRKSVSRLALFSVFWIIIGGIPRVLTFKSFEWANAVEKHHEPGLVVKYIIALGMIAGGAYLWILLLGKIQAVKKLPKTDNVSPNGLRKG